MEKHWLLEKYGRFVQQSNSVQESQGKWQESFNLIKSKEWLKAINKTDSVLFLYKQEEKVRRFRIKFPTCQQQATLSQHQQQQDGLQQCNEFIEIISQYINIQRINEEKTKQTEHGSQTTTINRIITVKSLTKNILDNRVKELPDYFQSSNLTMDGETTANMVKTCILDPNFPSFVESVEEALKNLTE